MKLHSVHILKSCSTLGIVIDADENISSRWESIKTICRGLIF
ncbi:DUF3226 domain-containing protein [Ferrovum myxofaciens]